MARNFGFIDAGIWDDPDFCGLSAGAQRTYFLLITQKEINACGSLALTLRRWSKTCHEKYLEAWLAELADAQFVLIDEDTEELLVRTFVKWDGGHKHARRRQAVESTARAIRSATLRATAWDELAKLGVTDGATTQGPDRDSKATAVPIESRRVVGYVSSPEKDNPQPATREPAPSEPDVEPSTFCDDHPKGTDKPCGPCGTRKLQHAAWVKRQARRSADLERRRSAALLAELAEARANSAPRPKAAS